MGSLAVLIQIHDKVRVVNGFEIYRLLRPGMVVMPNDVADLFNQVRVGSQF